ncbi:MAG: glycosyltransferase [Planctomycetota bacterium]
MRVVFFAKAHKRSGITTHMERGLHQLGHEVLRVNRRRLERLAGKRLAWWAIRRRIAAFRPDVILVFTFDLGADRLQELRSLARTATFFDDCPQQLDVRVRDAVAASDAFFITSRGQIAQYEQELGVTPAYVTGGCDPVDHFRVPPQPEFESDVAFIGQADARGGRVEVLQALAERCDVKVYGRGWAEVGLPPARQDVYPEQYRVICNSARVVIGNDLRQDVELYFSNRTWLSLGCGAFLATRYVPALEELLPHGERCVHFRSPEDAVRVVEEWLARPEDRARVAAAGHAFAHEQYSYARMLERMLAHPALRPAAP